MKLTLVLQHYNQWAQVERHLSLRAALPVPVLRQTELVIVDDASTEPAPALEVPLGTVIARVGVDVPWNQPGARNLGVQLARTPWLLLTDGDHFFEGSSLEEVLNTLDGLSATSAYWFPRHSQTYAPLEPHLNTYLLHRDTFELVGGVDEDFCGSYGCDDKFFAWQLDKQGVPTILHSATALVETEGKTRGMDRDAFRNRQLLVAKQQAGEVHSRGKSRVRFPWSITHDTRHQASGAGSGSGHFEPSTPPEG